MMQNTTYKVFKKRFNKTNLKVNGSIAGNKQLQQFYKSLVGAGIANEFMQTLSFYHSKAGLLYAFHFSYDKRYTLIQAPKSDIEWYKIGYKLLHSTKLLCIKFIAQEQRLLQNHKLSLAMYNRKLTQLWNATLT